MGCRSRIRRRPDTSFQLGKAESEQQSERLTDHNYLAQESYSDERCGTLDPRPKTEDELFSACVTHKNFVV
jgi:hypothetical protein